MPLKSRDVQGSLEAKGFKRVEGDHYFFIYYSIAGKKSAVRTKVSHGASSQDISDGLASKMARQCHLTNKEFNKLIACPLSRKDYEDLLVQQGFVDPPSADESRS